MRRAGGADDGTRLHRFLMATPAAVLSVLVDANTANATSKLTTYMRRFDTANAQARKGIEAQLGGRFNSEAFRAYENATSRVVRRNADREAFKAQLGANFSPAGFRAYQRELDRGERQTHASTTRMGNSFGSFARRTVIALGAIGGAFAAFAAARSAIEDTLALGEATIRLSAVTGMDTKQASTWIEAMKVRGIQSNQVALGFITLSKNIRNATIGTAKQAAAITALNAKQAQQRASLIATRAPHEKQAELHKKLIALQAKQAIALDMLKAKTTTATGAFKELGVSQAVLASGNTQKVLLAVADGLAKVKSPADRAALAQQLFGRGARALIPVLLSGRKGVNGMLASVQSYGAALPKNTKQTEASVRAVRNWHLALDGLKIAFTVHVLPVLVKVVGVVSRFIQQMHTGKGAGGVFAKILRAVGDGAGWVFRAVKDAVKWIGGMVQMFKQGNPWVIALAGALGGVAIALGIATAAMSVFGAVAAVVASPFLIVAAVIGAVVGALVLLYLKVKVVRDFINAAWQAIKNATMAVWPVVKAIVLGVFNAIKWFIQNIMIPAFKLVVWYVQHILLPVFRVVFPIIRGIVQTVFAAISWWANHILLPTFRAIKWTIHNVLIPAFNAIKGPVKAVVGFLASVFKWLWSNVIKPTFSFILGAIASFLKGIGAIAKVASHLPVVGKLFGGVSDSANQAAAEINKVRDALNGVPTKKVGVAVGQAQKTVNRNTQNAARNPFAPITGTSRSPFATGSRITNHIILNVARAADVPAVGDVLERVTGAVLPAQLKASGVTA